MTKKMLVQIVGAVFILIGLLGFLPNPIVGASPNALFSTDVFHNLVHIISGVLAFVLAMQGEKGAVMFGKIMTVVYGLVTVLGFLTQNGLFGLLPVNMADNVLHLLLTIVFAYVGFVPTTPAARAEK